MDGQKLRVCKQGREAMSALAQLRDGDAALLFRGFCFSRGKPHHASQHMLQRHAFLLRGDDMLKNHYSTLLRKSRVRGC